MKKGKKGFVVSAVLYPLLVLFLAIIMGLLSMTDTRKRILDKMKLEITDNIFDDAACSCDTILAKLNYIIANGTGGSGGDTGSYAYNKLTLNVKTYEAYSDFPVVGNIIGDIAVLSTTPIKNYYVSTSVPKSPQEGTVWIVQDNTSNYYVTSDWNRIGISYVMQYENSKWVLKKSYVYNGESWTMLYYVNLKNGYVDLTGTDINAEITKKYDYTGTSQMFTATFSGYYQIELWGAEGGARTKAGGKGAYTKGEIYLNAGEVLYIYVGGSSNNYNTGTYNGGGSGWASGGGATDVRLESNDDPLNFESLKSRIMVAGGGGGGASVNGGTGGAGGGIKADDRSFRGVAYGGSQVLGGKGGISAITGGTGSFGLGGTGKSGNGGASGGGGGGYYGGGGGGVDSSTDDDGPGAGGSSYISGHDGCSSISEESTSLNIISTGDKYHYSGKYFLNTKIVDGNGYEWSTKKETQVNMPSPTTNATITGNTGQGHATITLITVQVINDEIIDSKKYENDSTWSYTYNGTYQLFEVPVSGNYQIELWGAEGGARTNAGGAGGYTKGTIHLNKNEKFYLYVGGSPVDNNETYNGGGTGWAAGGGATDIRITKSSSVSDFVGLKSRIMVAGGGGGGASVNGGTGGAGGGIKADDRSFRGVAYGGSQVLGGKGGISAITGGTGSFGLGGTGKSGNGGASGGGGGGYYGGGGGGVDSSTDDDGPGAGGSSYISGHDGCSSISEESTSLNIISTGDKYHYSGYYFTNTEMKKGINKASGKAVIILLNRDKETVLDKYYLNFTWNYSVSLTYQEFTVPKTGKYKIELWGAEGGTRTNAGGKGAYTSGVIALSTNQKLYIYVGESPIDSTGTYNGGGAGWASGGGATDIRVTPTTALNIWNDPGSMNSRIMVAGGGGGGASMNGGTGGAGGGIKADDRSFRGVAYGGSQVSGGAGGISAITGGSGSFGIGGIGKSGNNGASGGGGAGWYGGGGGGVDSSSDDDGPGAGGSSYISGHAGCIGVNSSGKSLASTYSKLADSISYTGYSFTNTSMIDGTGYPWTTVKSSSSSGMPSPTSASLITGNTGDGYAKITYLGS